MNLPSNVRSAIYLLSVFINTFIAAIIAAGVHLSVFVIAGVAGINAVVAILAKVNVTPTA